MCGIFALLNNRETDIESIKTEFMKGKNRGPENSQFLYLTSTIHCTYCRRYYDYTQNSCDTSDYVWSNIRRNFCRNLSARNCFKRVRVQESIRRGVLCGYHESILW